MLRAEPHQEVLLYYCYAELSAADRQRLAAFLSGNTVSAPGHSALDDLALHFLRERLAGLQVLLEFDRGVPFANLRQKSHEKAKR